MNLSTQGLERFIVAQDSVYDVALDELAMGENDALDVVCFSAIEGACAHPDCQALWTGIQRGNAGILAAPSFGEKIDGMHQVAARTTKQQCP